MIWTKGYKKIISLWPYALIVALVFIVYSNVYDNAFLFDDEFLIQKNTFLRSWDYLLKIFANPSTAGSGGVDSFYRPMQGLLYLVVFQIFGLSTLGFHLLNVSIHAANAAMVYGFSRRLRFHQGASLLAALIWAVHPMHTEAVTYQSATADTLYVFFILLGLITVVPSFSWRRIVMACGFYVLAILSKESSVVFPLLVMSVLFLQSEKPWLPKTYLRTWPLWLLTGIYLILRKTLLNFDDTFNFYKTANIYTENVIFRIYTFFATLPYYLELMVYPHSLRMERLFPVFVQFGLTPVLLGFGIVLIFLVVLARGFLSRGKIFAWAGLWFFFAQIPHMGILMPVNSFFLEHWMYLPSIGLFLGLAEGLSRLEKKGLRYALVALAAVAVLAFGYKTYRQNEVWATPASFYGNILLYGEGSERVHNNLAMDLADRGELAPAAEHYLKAIEVSGDRAPQAQHNLALVLLKMNRVDEAIGHLKRAIEINPQFYYSYGILAEVFYKLGQPEEAKKYEATYRELTKKLQF